MWKEPIVFYGLNGKRVAKEHAHLFMTDQWLQWFERVQKATGFTTCHHTDKVVLFNRNGTDYYIAINIETHWAYLLKGNDKIQLTDERVINNLKQLGVKGFN